MTFFRIFSTTAALAVISAGAAGAATVTQTYAVTTAVGPVTDHGIWIEGGLGGEGADYVDEDFDFDPGTFFTLYDDGTATLEGTITSQTYPNARFAIQFNYDDDFPFTPEFKDANDAEFTSDLEYRDLEGGTMTGIGALLGLDIAVSRFPVDGPFAAQFGSSPGPGITGPNNKNDQFGLANWFAMTLLRAECGIICDSPEVAALSEKKGDVHANLNVPAPVPLPAAGWGLIAAIGALFGMRLRKSA